VPTPIRLGYLVPQFPGQTHMFFWREIAELERRGASVTLFSTRPPPKGLIAHDWSDAAMKRTEYLGQIAPLDALSALPRLPYARLMHHARHEPRAFLRDLALSVPAAQRLRKSCQRQGITHVHVHSCGRAALIAALARHMGGPSTRSPCTGHCRITAPASGSNGKGRASPPSSRKS
jgi:colanic acid/amylovoran biosynthesis glycosyltransferase